MGKPADPDSSVDSIRLVIEGSDVYRHIELPRDANEVYLHVGDYSVQVIVDGKAVRDPDETKDALAIRKERLNKARYG